MRPILAKGANFCNRGARACVSILWTDGGRGGREVRKPGSDAEKWAAGESRVGEEDLEVETSKEHARNILGTC